MKINAFFVTLGFLRVLGGFPYRWRNTAGSALEVTRSIPAALWSALVILLATVTSCYIICTNSIKDGSSIQYILKYILRTYWYAMLIFLYVYFGVYSRSLVNIVTGMASAGINLKRRILCVRDVPVGICSCCVVLGSLWSLLKMNQKDVLGGFARVTDNFSDIVILALLLLMYLLVKIISLDMEDTVKSFKKEENPPADIVWTISPPKNQTDVPSVTNQNPTQKCQLKSPAKHLQQLDDLVEQIVSYLGPPVALMLVNTITATTVFLYNAITGDIYYAVYVITPLSRMVFLVLVPDSLHRKVIMAANC